MTAKAYMMISTKHGQIDNVSEKLKHLDNVKGLHQIYGTWDIIVIIEAESMEGVNDLLSEAKKIEEVTGTETFICSDVN